MIDLPLSDTALALTGIAIVLAMFVLFVREAFPVEVVALSGAVAMLVLGILPHGTALAVLSNPAPWTIAALFIVVGALVRTGALDALGGFAARRVKVRPVQTLVLLILTVLGLSAVVNNTPVVVVMIPVFIQVAREMGLAPSKLLIPLSYASIFGGTLTLVGTSTNLLVDGVAQAQGMAAFGVFEITLAGLALATVGLVYLAVAGRFLLPDRQSLATLVTDRSRMKFFTEVAVPEGSPLIGLKPAEVDSFRRGGARVIDVLRGDASLRRNLGRVELQAGDRVVLRSPMAEVLGLQEDGQLRQVEKLSSVATTTVEVLVTPGCRIIGRSLGALRLRRRYGIYPIAVHRRDQNIGRALDDLVVQVGDTLLIEGAAEDIGRFATDMDVVEVARPTQRAYRRGHAPVAVGVLGGIVGLAALGVAPIVVLAFVGVAIVLLTRCIDADEAFGFIDGRLLALIFGMLAVGAGLQEAGSVTLIVDAAAPLMAGLTPFLLILSVYLLTVTLTELVTNNAVAVVLTPIAIGLAPTLGVDPRPLVVTVMLAASCSFSTPIGYQTNTMVYGPGGYRFTDFLRVGIPLNLLMALTASLVIPLLWPL